MATNNVNCVMQKSDSEEKVCAIIVTYNIGPDILKCFNSIIRQVDWVVIVDNGSGKETTDVLKDLGKENNRLTIFYNNDNLGIGSAQNIGARYAIDAGYQWVLMLDHDSEASPRMVYQLLDAYRALKKNKSENIGILAAVPFDLNINEFLVSKHLFRRDSEYHRVKIVISSGSLINVSVFHDIGFYKECLFIYYVDDDFCLRCHKHNWSIYLCRMSVLLHREGNKEIKKIFGLNFTYINYSCLARYYISRNSVYMFYKYFYIYRFSFGIIKRLLKDIIKIALFDKNRNKLLFFTLKGIFDGVLGRYGRLTVDDGYHSNNSRS